MSNVTGVDVYPQWIGSVITNEDGSIKDPMVKAENFFIFLFDIVNSSLTLPTNLYFGLVILCNSRLRNQPKYVMKFITTTVCSLFTVFTDGQEAIYFIWPSEQLCKSSVFTFLWSGDILLLNILLALIEQFVAISKPKLYNEKVTPLLVAVLSALINFLFILFIDWVYVFGVEPIRCAYNKKHFLTLVITWFLRLFSCAALAISIYAKTKPLPVDELTDLTEEALDLQKKMKSARQTVTGFIPILILIFLTKFISLSAYFCSLFYSVNHSTCSTLILISAYDDKLFSLSSLISPLIINYKDPELHSSPSLLKCFKPRHRPLTHSDILAIIRLNNLMKTTAV